MATFAVDFPEDFLKQLLQTDAEEIITEALTQAAPCLESEMKETLKKDNHELSGELIRSIKATKPKKATNEAWIVNVRPTGYSKVHSYTAHGKGGNKRKYNVSNALKMIWIEYGVSGRQPARPFLTRVVNKTRESVMKKMQEVYDRKVM